MATSPSNLTFAEAMALDPSEVEYRLRGERCVWIPFCVDMPVRELRSNWEFRRARPRRSRVQEMADRGVEPTPGKSYVETIATIAIRSVCEYIRETPRGYKDHDAQVAASIEREFLEPR